MLIFLKSYQMLFHHRNQMEYHMELFFSTIEFFWQCYTIYEGTLSDY